MWARLIGMFDSSFNLSHPQTRTLTHKLWVTTQNSFLGATLSAYNEKLISFYQFEEFEIKAKIEFITKKI